MQQHPWLISHAHIALLPRLATLIERVSYCCFFWFLYVGGCCLALVSPWTTHSFSYLCNAFVFDSTGEKNPRDFMNRRCHLIERLYIRRFWSPSRGKWRICTSHRLFFLSFRAKCSCGWLNFFFFLQHFFFY